MAESLKCKRLVTDEMERGLRALHLVTLHIEDPSDIRKTLANRKCQYT